MSGGRSRPARAAEAAGPDRPLRRCSGPVTPDTSVAPASGEGERPRPGLPGEGSDPVWSPGSSRTQEPAAASAGRGDVCVRACACLSARGFGGNGVWVAFRSPQTQSRISEVSGLWWPEGGDAPRTEASSRQPVRCASEEEPPRSRRCPRVPHARPSGRPPEADGARGGARGRAPRLQGARPSAMAEPPPGAAASERPGTSA